MSYQFKWFESLDKNAGEQLIALYNDALKSGTYLGYTEALEGEKAQSIIDSLNQKLAKGDMLFFAGFAGNEMVSTAQLIPNAMSNCKHIVEIAKGIVRSDQQGSGLMAESFLEVANHCQRLGYDLMVLDVRENSKPHNIWASLGFMPYGRMADYARVEGESRAGVYLEQPIAKLIENLKLAQKRHAEGYRGAQFMEKNDFKKKLREELETRITLTHPIIKKVLSETPNWELLRFMTLQGYQLTKHFLEYVETIFFHCPPGRHKRNVMFNMFEEETGQLSKTDNHVTLMENFIRAIGISDAERDAAVALPTTQALIDYRMDLVRNKNTFHMGAAAVLIGSEGQNLETAAGEARHDLLPKTYNLVEKDLLFFSVHQAEDVGHVTQGIDLVADFCTNARMQQEALEAVRTTCNLFYGMYDGVAEAYRKKAA